MSELSVNNHKIHDGDFVVMLDCLDELFGECGDAITSQATRIPNEKNFIAVYIILLPRTYIRC